MKQLSIIMLLLIGYSAYAQEQINDFNGLMDALKSGKEVRVVIDYSKCKLLVEGKESESVDAIGGMTINSFEYFAVGTVRNEKAYVTFSETVLINHGFYGIVYNYAKLRVYEDQSVEVIAQYIDPISFELKMDEKFTTIISNNDNEGALFLFAD